MLEALKVIILGIVQGITEWLPISSTGHLILVEELIKLQQNDAFKNMFNVVIQFGSIMAVVVIYFHKLNPFFTNEDAEAEDDDDPVVDQSDYRNAPGNDRGTVIE